MLKWSDVLARIIPWLDTDTEDAHLREETAAVEREQQMLAPFITAQSDYLVGRGELNGFSRQLRNGFRLRAGGE